MEAPNLFCIFHLMISKSNGVKKYPKFVWVIKCIWTASVTFKLIGWCQDIILRNYWVGCCKALAPSHWVRLCQDIILCHYWIGCCKALAPSHWVRWCQDIILRNYWVGCCKALAPSHWVRWCQDLAPSHYWVRVYNNLPKVINKLVCLLSDS